MWLQNLNPKERLLSKKPFVNYYLLLNVPATASLEEIKEAYFRLVKLYHPDKNQGNRIAEKKFQQLNSAWEVLKDPEKKIRFDRQLAALKKRKIKKLEEKGIDLEYALKVSLEDICQGRSKNIQYIRPVCRLKEKQSFVFQIPLGTKEGSRLYFKGQGGAKGRKKFGDLYVLISIRPHKLFQPIESSFDLMIQQPLPFVSAFQCDKLETLSPYGFLSLEPKRTIKDGEVLRLTNQGLPKNKKGDKGDLFVKFLIDYPLELGVEVQTAMERLSEKEKSAYIKKIKKRNFIYPEVLKFQKKLQEIKRKYYE